MDKIKGENKKFNILLVVLSVLLIIAFFTSMCVGRYDVSFTEVFKFFTGQQIDQTSYNIMLYLRLPRTLIAVLVGIALTLSGAIYQSSFNNRLVSPDLLGVSSGASVGACFAILLGFSTAMISVFAFIVGFVTVFITLLIAKAFKNKSNVILILAGLAVGGVMSSLVGLIKYLADNEMKLAEMTFWLLGDLSKVTMDDFYVLLPVVVVCSIITIVLSWRLNIISLGQKEAKSLGVNYKVNFVLLIVVATVLTAISVSVSGTIGWIGLVIPNITRLLIGSNNKKLIPISMLIGAIFMVIVDMLARSLAPNEIPLSVITGILGTPIFIFAIYKRRKEIR